MTDTHAPLDSLVIGAGPAGLTAGVYLRRFHRDVIIVDEGDSRARRIPVSHNYPGFPAGIPGVTLLARMREQLADVNGQVMTGKVVGIEPTPSGFLVDVGEREIAASTVLVATGVSDAEPTIRGIEELRRDGLLRQCPICDGFEFTNRRIAVIASGDHGARESLFLRNYSPDVCCIAQDDAFDIAEDLSRQLSRQGVRVIPGVPVEVVRTPEGDVRFVMKDGAQHDFDVAYAALGCRPRSDIAVALGARSDNSGNLIVDAHCRTGIAGLYAAGDVVSGLHQLAVAVGQAATAATAIHNDLRSQA